LRKDVVWRTDRQNQSDGATCARDEETKKKEKKPYSNQLRRRFEVRFCMR